MWSSQKVGQWLESLNLEQYVAEFAAQDVDGQQLLLLDGAKLKVVEKMIIWKWVFDQFMEMKCYLAKKKKVV